MSPTILGPRLAYRPTMRRVVFEGHQMYWEAYFVAWTKDRDGRLQAVLESEDGTIRIENSIYCLQFVDPVPEHS